MKNLPRKIKLAAILGALITLLMGTAANAEIKNFAFNGVIDVVEDQNLILDGSIEVGMEFSGFYIFDSTTEDSNSDSTVGDYFFRESKFGIITKIGDYVFRTNPRKVEFLIEVVNRPGGDAYLLRSYYNVANKPVSVEHISWQLDDLNGTAISDISLPLTPPALQNWQSPFGLTIEGGNNSFFIRGTVTSIHEAPAITPEIPPVSIHDATELRWQSKLGYFYQIQSSEDMQNWTNVGDPILGAGNKVSKFMPRNSDNIFYRAVIANFEE